MDFKAVISVLEMKLQEWKGQKKSYSNERDRYQTMIVATDRRIQEAETAIELLKDGVRE